MEARWRRNIFGPGPVAAAGEAGIQGPWKKSGRRPGPGLGRWGPVTPGIYVERPAKSGYNIELHPPARPGPVQGAGVPGPYRTSGRRPGRPTHPESTHIENFLSPTKRAFGYKKRKNLYGQMSSFTFCTKIACNWNHVLGVESTTAHSTPKGPR